MQVFRIQDNVTEVEVNPRPEAFWNNHARYAFHSLSSSRRNIVIPNTIDFVWYSFEKYHLPKIAQQNTFGILVELYFDHSRISHFLFT